MSPRARNYGVFGDRRKIHPTSGRSSLQPESASRVASETKIQQKPIMKTIATLFTGFGGVEVGAMNAGLRPLWGIENDPDIAVVANRNLGNHVLVVDILDVDPTIMSFPITMPWRVGESATPCRACYTRR